MGPSPKDHPRISPWDQHEIRVEWLLDLCEVSCEIMWDHSDIEWQAMSSFSSWVVIMLSPAWLWSTGRDLVLYFSPLGTHMWSVVMWGWSIGMYRICETDLSNKAQKYRYKMGLLQLVLTFWGGHWSVVCWCGQLNCFDSQPLFSSHDMPGSTALCHDLLSVIQDVVNN